jgi:creatinine amidohydrolase
MISLMKDEVRYWMCRPDQILARRQACPVAYIPIGTLEWHGPHDPVGTDTLQAEGLAVMCAERGGGLVLPPLYYGESRSESLVEATHPDREAVARAMALPPENFLPDRQPFSATEQMLNYQRLLLHILAEAESLGFTVGVLVAGHYPLIEHARAAALLFNKRYYSKYHGLLAWACLDYLFLEDRYEFAGDHASGWETSHMLALHPQTVDLGRLPPKGEPVLGVAGRLPPQEASAELGWRTLEESAEIIVQEVRHRLEHPEEYRRHGGCLREGLWRKQQVRRPNAGSSEKRR